MAAFLVQWHSRTTVKQRKKRAKTESGGEIERFGRNPVLSARSSILLRTFAPKDFPSTDFFKTLTASRK